MIKKVVVSGTGTEVGKTWVAARVAEALLGRGMAVSARKPVQSYAQGAGATDAEVLGAATGEDVKLVCPPEHWYSLPMAPPMAADALGALPIYLAELVEALAIPDQGVCLIEGVGGPRSPLAHDGDTVDLAEAIDADLVILVGQPGLGVLNDVRMGADAFAPRDVIVFLNRYDDALDLHRRNRSWLSEARSLMVTVEVQEVVQMLSMPEV